MEQIVCTTATVLRELRSILGEEAANDVLYGFLQASDHELKEIRNTLDVVCASTAVGR